jgi:hypothetical protein
MQAVHKIRRGEVEHMNQSKISTRNKHTHPVTTMIPPRTKTR